MESSDGIMLDSRLSAFIRVCPFSAAAPFLSFRNCRPCRGGRTGHRTSPDCSRFAAALSGVNKISPLRGEFFLCGSVPKNANEVSIGISIAILPCNVLYQDARPIETHDRASLLSPKTYSLKTNPYFSQKSAPLMSSFLGSKTGSLPSFLCFS